MVGGIAVGIILAMAVGMRAGAMVEGTEVGGKAAADIGGAPPMGSAASLVSLGPASAGMGGVASDAGDAWYMPWRPGASTGRAPSRMPRYLFSSREEEEDLEIRRPKRTPWTRRRSHWCRMAGGIMASGFLGR